VLFREMTAVSCDNHKIYFFFLWRRAPQQMLRTHRGLEVYCATVWWRWLVFFFVFPTRYTLVQCRQSAEFEILIQVLKRVTFQAILSLTETQNMRIKALASKLMTLGNE
jgi:energy-converting hydrogenase Eha subunit G